MTIKYTFFIGLNDKESHLQEIDTITAGKIVQRVFTSHECGATITSGQGVYVHNDGSVVAENTIIVQVYEFSPVPVKDICRDLKALLNQESIAVEKTDTNSQLY